MMEEVHETKSQTQTIPESRLLLNESTYLWKLSVNEEPIMAQPSMKESVDANGYKIVGRTKPREALEKDSRQ